VVDIPGGIFRLAAEVPFARDRTYDCESSRRPTAELAKEIDVDLLLFSDFRAGEAKLPATALDRLLETLGLRLMQEIPR
jgi:hypothetical protein